MPLGPCVERVREVFSYDPATGELRWRRRPHPAAWKVIVGEIAGWMGSEGYREVQLDGASYKVHRLIWLYTTGIWPTHALDHRNGIRDDNRFENLRQATRTQNGQNQNHPHRHGSSGFLGVNRCNDGWQARITVEGKRRHLGTFHTPEEAHAVYVEAKRELHPFWVEGV